MKKELFAVSTDSTSDLRPSYAKARDIYLAPLTYTLEKDGVIEEGLDAHEKDEEIVRFYERVSGGWFPRTAKLNFEAHLAHFRRLGEAGVEDALHFMISSGLANTVELTRLAAEEIRKEYPALHILPIDPLTATVGQGMLTRMAADCRDRGMDAKEAAAYLEEAKNRVQHCIIPSDLFYLKKGGRVSTTAAVIGSMLNVKPVLVFDENGKLAVKEKCKGMKKAFARVLEHLERAPLDEAGYAVVVHTNNPEGANALAEMINSRFGIQAEIVLMGPVIGSHVGPGSVSFAWLSTKTRTELLQDLYK